MLDATPSCYLNGKLLKAPFRFWKKIIWLPQNALSLIQLVKIHHLAKSLWCRQIKINNWHSTEDDLENHENRISPIHPKQWMNLCKRLERIQEKNKQTNTHEKTETKIKSGLMIIMVIRTNIYWILAISQELSLLSTLPTLSIFIFIKTWEICVNYYLLYYE